MRKQAISPAQKDILAEEIVETVQALPERNRQEVLGYIRAVRDMTSAMFSGASTMNTSAQVPPG